MIFSYYVSDDSSSNDKRTENLAKQRRLLRSLLNPLELTSQACGKMKILDLPNEMLMAVATLLPLNDLFSLSQTCRRFNEVTSGPCMTKKCVLWLNKLEQKSYMYGGTYISNRSIDVETLQKSEREYHAFGIQLPAAISDQQLSTVKTQIAVLMKRQIVRNLYVIDSNTLQIVALRQNFPTLFQTLQELSVTVTDAMIKSSMSVEWDMPNLRSIKWNELKYHSELWQNRYVHIYLHAPMLKKAIFVPPKDMYVKNHDFRTILVLKTVDQLEELECVLSNQTVELLTHNRMPALKRISLMKEEYRVEVDWDIIANNVPELQKLEIRRNLNMVSAMMELCSFVTYCTMLTELHLESLDMTELAKAPHVWDGIQTLHLHECLLLIPSGKTLVLNMPNVRKFCGGISLTRQGKLVLSLPKVEHLSLSRGNDNLDILEMPMLETLHLRIRLRRRLTFLEHSMPHLRNLILDTPQTFVPKSELQYHLLLGSVIQLTNLTVICRTGVAINGLLAKINTEQPTLKTLRMIGDGIMSKINRSTLSTILSLPNLESLLMVNIQLTSSLRRDVPLPPKLRRLRIRTLCMAPSSRFVSVTRAQRQLGKIVEHKVLTQKYISANPSEIPNYEDIKGPIELCFDNFKSLEPNA